jgi:hypothetical protein
MEKATNPAKAEEVEGGQQPRGWRRHIACDNRITMAHNSQCGNAFVYPTHPYAGRDHRS